MIKSLTHNSINTRSVTTNEVGLAVGEVVVASPAYKFETISKQYLVQHRVPATHG